MLYGPTCDSSDYLPGPFVLPACVREGDYIEIGQVGAYGRVLANRFNGFGEYDEVMLTDEPMLSMFESRRGRGAASWPRAPKRASPRTTKRGPRFLKPALSFVGSLRARLA